MYVASIYVETYDYDFGLCLDGEEVKEGITYCRMGETPTEALTALRAGLTYFGGFFSDYYADDRANPTDGWAKAFHEDLCGFGEFLATGSADGVSYGYADSDVDHYWLNWSGNRVVSVNVCPQAIVAQKEPEVRTLKDAYTKVFEHRMTYSEYVEYMRKMGFFEK